MGVRPAGQARSKRDGCLAAELCDYRPPALTSPACTAARLFRSFQPFPVAQNLARRVVSRDARDAAARMRRGAALEESGDRRAVVGPVRRRPLPEQLVGAELAVKDVALGQADDALEIRRRKQLVIDDLPREVRRPGIL